MNISEETVQKLIEYSETSLARCVGVKRQQVQDWTKHARVPDDYVLAVERATGFKLNGEWTNGRREICKDCNCQRFKD